MNKNDITRFINRGILKVKKNSPTILLSAGLIGSVAGTVLACKATTKLSDIIKEYENQCDQTYIAADREDLPQYTEDDATKDRKIILGQTIAKCLKIYTPAIITTTLSFSCIIYSHKIMRNRCLALAATVTALDTAFKNYRKEVSDRFGEDVEHEIRYGIKNEEITTVDEDGNEIKKTVKTTNGNIYSPYAKIFDELNENYESDSEYNLMFLKAQQNYANDLLQSRGYLYLNEVYDMLGMAKTKAGQVVGWIYDPEKNVEHDNYVDFGLYNTNKKSSKDFIDGITSAVILDFNVDGDIWTNMDKQEEI